MPQVTIQSTTLDGAIAMGGSGRGIHQFLLEVIPKTIGETPLSQEGDIVISGKPLTLLIAKIDSEIRNRISALDEEIFDINFNCKYQGAKVGIDSQKPNHQLLSSLIEVETMLSDAIGNKSDFRISYYKGVSEPERKIMFTLNARLRSPSTLDDIIKTQIEVFGTKHSFTKSETQENLKSLIKNGLLTKAGDLFAPTDKGKVFF